MRFVAYTFCTLISFPAVANDATFHLPAQKNDTRLVGRANVNTAPPELLRLVPELSEPTIQAILALRAVGRVTDLGELLLSAAAQAHLTVEGESNLRLIRQLPLERVSRSSRAAR